LYQELQLVNLDDKKDVLVVELATTLGELKATNATQQMGVHRHLLRAIHQDVEVVQIKDNNLDPDGHQSHDSANSVQTSSGTNDDLHLEYVRFNWGNSSYYSAYSSSNRWIIWFRFSVQKLQRMVTGNDRKS
jgi:uncharacterized protein YaaQ